MVDYRPIPLYSSVEYDLVSEACHLMLISPSGGGKSMLLSYLAGMTLKRGHRLYLADAKNTALGATFKSLGVKTATTPKEIVAMLAELINEMEQVYQDYFSSDEIDLDTNFSMLDLPGHVLVFDEVLSALDSGSKEEKTEMTRLLKQLALKGRMAGFAIILTSQRLLATDLPKAITEQCQTRILMGANVSEELFHTALGGYKKDLASAYRGGVGKGYAVTPKTGLTYFEAPYMDFEKVDFKQLLRDLKGESDDGN